MVGSGQPRGPNSVSPHVHNHVLRLFAAGAVGALVACNELLGIRGFTPSSNDGGTETTDGASSTDVESGSSDGSSGDRSSGDGGSGGDSGGDATGEVGGDASQDVADSAPGESGSDIDSCTFECGQGLGQYCDKFTDPCGNVVQCAPCTPPLTCNVNAPLPICVED
jgi:hypothetical protein